MLHLRLYGYRIINSRAPPDHVPDLPGFVIHLARSVGFTPSGRRPMPETAKPWSEMTYFVHDIAARQRVRSAGMLSDTGK